MLSFSQDALRIKIAFSAVNSLPAYCLDHCFLVKIVPLAADLLPALYKLSCLLVSVIPFVSDLNKAGLPYSLAVKIIGRIPDLVHPPRYTGVIRAVKIINLTADVLKALQKLSVFDRCVIPLCADLEEPGDTLAFGVKIIPVSSDREESVFDIPAVGADVVHLASNRLPHVFGIGLCRGGIVVLA